MKSHKTLSEFPEPRILLSDIESLRTVRVQVERVLRKTLKKMTIPDGWDLRIERGASGRPGITVESPELPNGDHLFGQIEVTHDSMKKTLNEVRLNFYAGTYVDDSISIIHPWIQAPLRHGSTTLEFSMSRC